MPTHGAQFIKIDLAEHYKQGENINIGSNDAMMGLKKVAAPARAGTKAKIR